MLVLAGVLGAVVAVWVAAAAGASSAGGGRVPLAGLNHYQQRYSRGGNQFSVEPPDQGLCVGASAASS